METITKKKIFLLVNLLFSFLIVCLTNAQSNKSIVVEVVEAFQDNGYQGVIEYTLKNKEKITPDSIKVIALTGNRLNNEIVIKIALSMAEILNYKSLTAWCKYYLAKNLLDKLQSKDALKELDSALKLFTEVNDIEGKAYVFDLYGSIYKSQKEYPSAKEAYLKVIEYSKILQDNYLQGWGHHQLGEIAFESGANDEALKMYSSALTFFLKDKDLERMVGLTYYSLGSLLLNMNEFSKSIDMFSNSLSHYKSVNYLTGQATALSSLGELYCFQNNYQKALEMFTNALTILEKEPDNINLILINSSIGKIYMEIGEYDKAKEFFAKSLKISALEKNNSAIAQIYISLGDIYSATDNKTESMRMYIKSLPYIKKSNTRYNVAKLLTRVGEQFNHYGFTQDALDTYSQALPIYQTLEDIEGQGKVLLEKGKVFIAIGDFKNAMDNLNKSLELIKNTDEISLKADLLLAQASLFNKINEVDKAYESYDKALGILEKIRTEIGFADMKMSFSEKISHAIGEATLFMIKNNHPEKAHQYLESIKARTLLDQLAEKSLGEVEKGLSPNLKELRDKLTTRLSFINSSLIKSSDEFEIKNLKSEKKELEQAWDKLNYQIRFQNPIYSNILYPKIVSIDELQKNILTQNEVLLNYFVFEKEVYLYVITCNNFKIVLLPDSTKIIEKEVQDYQRNLQYNRPVVESSLFNKLIEPVWSYIKDYKTLIIMPDAFLTNIPFESIIISYDELLDRPKYLIENFSIKYIQSATMLSLIRKGLNDKSKSDTFIGFGDPVYDYENFIAGKPEKGQRESSFTNIKSNIYNRSGGLMNRLEGSGIEVNEIAKIFGAKNSKVLTRLDAKEENIKNSDMKKYGYIVLSCHGLVSDQFQSLVLSQIPNSGEDGYLTLDEIMNLDWNAKLVVLSACQTGKGKLRRGEGVIGLTRAVMYAGTPAAIVSLWNVSDEGTKELMIKLFKNIVQKKMSKEEALSKAKIEMLNSKFSNPYFWSAFVMYGE